MSKSVALDGLDLIEIKNILSKFVFVPRFDSHFLISTNIPPKWISFVRWSSSFLLLKNNEREKNNFCCVRRENGNYTGQTTQYGKIVLVNGLFFVPLYKSFCNIFLGTNIILFALDPGSAHNWQLECGIKWVESFFHIHGVESNGNWNFMVMIVWWKFCGRAHFHHSNLPDVLKIYQYRTCVRSTPTIRYMWIVAFVASLFILFVYKISWFRFHPQISCC